MELPRRNFLYLITCAAALPFVPRIARAQAYPSRPIKLVIPFPPGGTFDAVGHPWAERVKPLLGSVVVENIGGGGSSIGAAAVARAQPDGYTILLGGTQTLVNEALLKSRPLYDPMKDLDPIASLATNFLCIAVHPAVPAHTLKELYRLRQSQSRQAVLRTLRCGLDPASCRRAVQIARPATPETSCRCRIGVLVL